jgi:chemotaxis response regulator CheB
MQYQAIVIGVLVGGMSALKIIFSALPVDFVYQ